ncbi:hypothetical protein NDU88_003425 [Pleurodeles waltl]|uniref:4'-phosphopantetheinyl transferase superfamily protein n=1 Tax=Pleurodeles waltl TaxID=8319 RepID=A0AAV7M3C9_PLEWA|nr:hypothetical protein NDU88_003425 [Pleurodeles waltl]
MAASGVVLSPVRAPHRKCSCFGSTVVLEPGRRVSLCGEGEAGRLQQSIAASPPGGPIFGPKRPRGRGPVRRPRTGARRAIGPQPDRGVEDAPAVPGRVDHYLTVSRRASGPRGKPARGRRKGPSLRGAEAADTPRSLFRAWATAEVARSVVWGAGLTPIVVVDPQLFKAFQEPG